MKKEIIKTDRLILKSIEDQDFDDFILITTSPLVNKSYMLPDFNNEEEKHNFFNRIKKATEDRSRFIYGIYLNNKIIGFINEVHKENERIEIGYFIEPNMWNRGYASEALKVAIKELFSLGYRVVEAAHFEDNLASGKVMMKCGMHKIDKTEDLEYRGKMHHCIYYEINS